MNRCIPATRRAAAGLVVALAALVLGSSPALACVGSRLDGPPSAGPGGVVFTGTAVRREDALQLVPTGMDSIAWTFVVDDVLWGPVPERITVTSPREELCGTDFVLGNRYTVRAEPGEGGSMVVPYGEVDSMEPLPEPPPIEGSTLR